MVEKFIHLDTGAIESTESFFSDRFLKARIESGNPSNEGLDLIFEENRSSDWQEQHWKNLVLKEIGPLIPTYWIGLPSNSWKTIGA